MSRRHSLPHRWLLTDERQGEKLWAVLEGLRPGSGVIFRHYGSATAERRALFDRARSLIHPRIPLLLAGTPAESRAWRADGIYGPRGAHGMLHLIGAHDLREIRAAERIGADAILLSPLYATRSHPVAPTLGRVRFSALARATRLPVFALGGVDHDNRKLLRHVGARGSAGIDSFTTSTAAQKRNAVPT